jgi:hypothetical protein
MIGRFEVLVAATSPGAAPRSIEPHELPHLWQHTGTLRAGKITLADYTFELPSGSTRPNRHPAVSIVLKRGTGGASLQQWRASQGDAVLTALDPMGRPIAHHKLTGAWITKITGPALSGKGGGDVAIEEVMIACEGLSLVPHHRTRARRLRHS